MSHEHMNVVKWKEGGEKFIRDVKSGTMYYCGGIKQVRDDNIQDKIIADSG